MKITTIILDWAGTSVDFGSMAPVDAFITAFEAHGITPTTEETRAPMGLPKRAHIATMLSGERLLAAWQKHHGRTHTEVDIDAIYARFETILFESLSNYATPLPDVLETVAKIRESGIKIGSTTGYTRPMMDIVASLAKEQGYAPDCLVCPEDVGHGRPYPYMIWRNLELLGTKNIAEVLKLGDTEADMHEGKAAGCLTAGVVVGSSMLGLSEGEWAALSGEEQAQQIEKTRAAYFAAGADFVIDSIRELPTLIRTIGG